MVHISMALALVGSERQLRLNVFCEVQQEMWLWSAGRWFQTAGKASMIPHADDDEMGTNRHLIYCIFSCTMQIAIKAMISFVPRIFIGDWNGRSLDDISLLISLLLFVRLTVPPRRYRNQQDTFCRLLTLTGRSRCGVAFYLILHMSRAFGLYLQRTASAFECVLRGATGDVVVVGGRVVSNGRKSVDSRDERCLVCAINRLQY